MIPNFGEVFFRKPMKMFSTVSISFFCNTYCYMFFSEIQIFRDDPLAIENLFWRNTVIAPNRTTTFFVFQKKTQHAHKHVVCYNLLDNTASPNSTFVKGRRKKSLYWELPRQCHMSVGERASCSGVLIWGKVFGNISKGFTAEKFC